MGDEQTESTPSRRGRGTALHALRYRDFRILAGGNMVSQLGTWAQYVALGSIAPTLTDSRFIVSVLFSSLFLPYLVLSPFTGVVADRYDRRLIVLWGNVSMVLPAVAIGVLVQLDKLTVVSLFGLVMVSGVGQTFAQPAATALVPALVPDEDLHSAVALNNGLSNSTRVVGPVLGAALIEALGMDWAFYIRGVSVLAVAFACMTIKPRPIAASGVAPAQFFESLRSGIVYLRKNRAAMHILVLVSIESFFMMHSSLMPLINRDVLGGDHKTYGVLSSAPGFGFVAAAVIVTLLATDGQRLIALFASCVGVGTSLVIISVSSVTGPTVGALVLFGVCYMVLTTIAATLLLATTDDEYRGRVMGLYGTFAIGLFGVNALAAGALAEWLGAARTIGTCSAIILGLVVVFVAFGSPRVIKEGLAARHLAMADVPG